MAVTQQHVSEVLEAAAGEGNPMLRLAPTASAPGSLPDAWIAVLANRDPRVAVIDALWQPYAGEMPQIIDALRGKLQGIGILTTDSLPPSLIYFFTLSDGNEPFFYRGFVPAPTLPAAASLLPPEFVAFYRTHDGWINQLGTRGPLPSRDWTPLGNEPDSPASKFLVVMDMGSGAFIGFDTEENPALCHTIWSDDPPELNPSIWTTFDAWLAGRFEQMQPFSP